jgi:hypothetical protein
MAAPASRYGITTVDLNQAAQAVQVGDLGTFALTSPIAVAKIVEAEDQVEGHVRDRISVPLSPVPAPGETTLPEVLTARNFESLFIQGVKYWALALLVQSSFSENHPNKSEYGEMFMGLSLHYLDQFRDQAQKRAGSGRLKHENPFMPPVLVQPTPKQPGQ